MGMDLSDAPGPRADTISRWAALRRFRRVGMVVTAGAGLLELAGIPGAPGAGAPGAPPTRGHAGSDDASTSPVIVLGGTPDPAGCRCTGTLAEGHCPGGPCPPGFYCYEVNFCGSADSKYACLNCEGTPTCSYDCS
jgi:hypothetical protein